ncbi:MAG: (d)CMP kinase [Burkholderiales bacterium]|nr:MAG: (d)CMP kinase [Burkholderiales bacterium]
MSGDPTPADVLRPVPASIDARRAPVLTLDGPTASGKGTIAQRVAQALGWHYLDSGALYRLTALAALRAGVPLDAADRLARVAATLPVGFGADGRIALGGEDVTEAIRDEAVGNGASRLAVHPGVRTALLGLQRGFRRPPGLVADGRDMGTVVFPDAALKVFLTASAESRAERRHKQLIEKGISANLPGLLQDLRERDARDASRSVAPLAPAEGAYVLDSTSLTVDETVSKVLDRWAAQG